MILASNEFVDLDEIVPGTGFKKQEDSPKKKDSPVQKKQAPEPVVEVYGEDGKQESPFQEEKKSEDVKRFEEKKKPDREESKPKEKQEEGQKQNGSNGRKEKAPAASRQEKQKEPEDKKQASKATFKQIMSKKRDSKKTKSVNAKETKRESRVVSSRKEKGEKSKGRKETNWTLIALLILAVIIVCVIIYVALKFDFTKLSGQESVVAVVNGQPIYKSELVNRYNLIKTTTNPFITEEQALNLTIMDRLLLQEAAKRGISTSDEEVNSLMNEIMAGNNINEASLREDLAAKNISYDFLIQMYKSTLTVNKLINDSFGNLTVSNAELKEFYEENSEQFMIPDMVQARHILFLFGNESENETYARAKEVFDMINDNRSNFCSLGEKYNQDTASIDYCGEYNFSIDYPFVPEFLEAGFDMKPSEVRIVKTQLGYHIMYKIADLPGYIPDLSTIKDGLEPVLLQEKTLEELNLMIEDLRNDAIIEIYNENITSKRFNEITAVKEEIPKDTAVKEETQGEVPEVPSAGEVIDVDVPVQSEVTKELVSTPKSQKMVLANCLNDKGVRMFTASWSPDSQEQLALFEEYASSLKIVECDPEENDADLAECSKVLKKKYPTWPTWQIGETLYEGVQSLNTLSKNSGCPY